MSHRVHEGEEFVYHSAVGESSITKVNIPEPDYAYVPRSIAPDIATSGAMNR